MRRFRGQWWDGMSISEEAAVKCYCSIPSILFFPQEEPEMPRAGGSKLPPGHVEKATNLAA